jgi:hypothetical protein
LAVGADESDEFARVRAALDDAGLPSGDFGRFASGKYPGVIRPEVFDYRRAVPVLLELLPILQGPRVKEAVVRSLSTGYAKGVAAASLVREFERTRADEQPGLKWALGNALETVAETSTLDDLMRLAADPAHGKGRQMVVLRLGRGPSDQRVVDLLMSLLDDEDVALHAMSALRRRVGIEAARPHIEARLSHDAAAIRQAAQVELKSSRRALRRKSAR